MLTSDKYIEIQGDMGKDVGINDYIFSGEVEKNSEETEIVVNSTELNKHFEKIVSNIYTVNRAWRALHRSIKILANDCVDLRVRQAALKTQKNCNHIVTQLFKDLHQVRDIVRFGNKQQKLHVEKLTSNFRDAVEEYQRIEKEVMENIKKAFHSKKRKISYDTFEDEYNYNEESSKAIKQLLMLELSMEFENTLLLEYAEGRREIETEILDLDHIIKELNELVPKLQDMVTQETNEEVIVDLGEIVIDDQSKIYSSELIVFLVLCLLVCIMTVGAIVALV